MDPSVPAADQRHCPYCHAVLPPTQPRFCIECGGPLQGGAPAVQLPNARVGQSVLGGTVRLPTSGAIPPGLWLQERRPGPDDVVAVYVPLRAIVGGWSGLLSAGWRLSEQSPDAYASDVEVFRFECRREWFAAPGCAGDLRLCVQISAFAEASEGRTRRGFRYRVAHDPPMEVSAAWWSDPRTDARLALPLPRIQLMAPPRVARVSDYDESIRDLPAPDAAALAREGQVHEVCHLLRPSQQRTPAGRGLLLGVESSAPLFTRLVRMFRSHDQYYVQIERPFVCGRQEWVRMQPRIQAEARELGLDMETDAVVEWWLDRHGHDGAVFDDMADRYGYRRLVVAFRRAQVIKIRA